MTDSKDSHKNSHRVFMGTGKFNPEIKGDFIQGDVISFGGKTPTPTPERKDLSKNGDAIDVKSEEV